MEKIVLNCLFFNIAFQLERKSIIVTQLRSVNKSTNLGNSASEIDPWQSVIGDTIINDILA